MNMYHWRKWLLTDARSLVLVFAHSPSPPVENEEIEIDDKNKKDDVEFGKSEDEGYEMVKADKDEDEASKLETRASIHYVSRSMRLRPGEKLVAEVSSSSSSVVLSSPMSGILLSVQDLLYSSFTCFAPWMI